MVQMLLSKNSASFSQRVSTLDINTHKKANKKKKCSAIGD